MTWLCNSCADCMLQVRPPQAVVAERAEGSPAAVQAPRDQLASLRPDGITDPDADCDCTYVLRLHRQRRGR